ncbi:TPA: DUF551 domain-containing protein [Raoultella planticola]
MTSKLTREWLQQTISDIQTRRDNGSVSWDDERENILQAFELALAAMDSKPVAWQYRVSAGPATGWSLWHDGKGEQYENSYKVERRPLYRHAQPAPVVQMVPEEPPEHLMPKGNTVDATYRRGAAIQAWKQCRAAMLQAGNSPAHSGLCPEQGSAPPAQDGCSPAQNQGWIPVGERMPGSQEWVIVFAKWANQQVLCWDDVQNRWTDFEDQSYYADMFSHWMPLPAAPQEVKGEHQIRDEMDMGARITSHRFKV